MNDDILGIQATLKAEDFKKGVNDFLSGLNKMDEEATKFAAHIQKLNLDDALADSVPAIKAAEKAIREELEKLKASFRDLPDELKKTELGQQIANQIKVGESALEDFSNKVKKQANEIQIASKQYNGLGIQIGMLARELPNLAFSFSTFALAISNNLPMLGDEIARANKEVEELKAAGKSFTPVWKQVVSSLFSWQTALIAGTSLLVLYGEEIGNWIKELIKGNKVLKSTKEVQEAVNKQLSEAGSDYGKQVSIIKTLVSEWENLGNSIEKQNQFIKENRQEFSKLGISIESATDFENAFIDNTEVLLASLKARVQAMAASEMATKEYEKALSKEIERDSTPKTLKHTYSVGKNVFSIFDEKNKRTVEYENPAYKKLEEETSALYAAGDAYIELGNAKLLEAKKTLEAKKIKSGSAESETLFSLEAGNDNKANISAMAKEVADAKMKLLLEAEKAETEAMSEGISKRMKQLRDRQKKELLNIEEHKQKYIKAVIELEKAKFEAQENEKAKQSKNYKKATFNPESFSLSESDETLFSNIVEATKNKHKSEERRAFLLLEQFEKDITFLKKTELEKRLYDIEKHYEKAIQQAEGYTDIINKLQEAKKQEIKAATLKDELNSNSSGREIELASTGNKFFNTGLYELEEQKKNEILLRYAEERKAILEQIGDEQAQTEIASLNVAIESYNKALKKPKSIKQMLDEKVFKAVRNQFVKLGKTEEEANEKTLNFFRTFSDSGAIASDVIGTIQGVFCGMSKELDIALEAAQSIAQGFSQGGLIGGLQQAAGIVVSATANLLLGKKQVSEAMKEQYEAYIEAIDRIINKQIDSLQTLGGKAFTETINESYRDLQKKLDGARTLIHETLKSGSGLFSHSVGYKTNKILKGYTEQLREAGIYTNDIYKFTNIQLVSLMKMPEIWARLNGDVRKYIEDMAEAYDSVEGINDQLKEMLLGFNAESITDAIVNAITDNSIDDAMKALSSDMDKHIAGIVKNIIVKMALIEPVTEAVNSLMKGIAEYNPDGTLKGFKDVDDIEKDVFSKFKETIETLGSGFAGTWKDLVSEFNGIGIDFNTRKDSLSQESSKRGFGSEMTHEDAGELSGRFSAVYESNLRIESAVMGQTEILKATQVDVELLRKQEEYQNQMFSEIIDIQNESVTHLADINRNTKDIAKSARETNDRLSKIEGKL